MTVTIAINVNGGTHGWLLNDLHVGQQAARRASCASVVDDARRGALRSSTGTPYQAFLDALRM